MSEFTPVATVGQLSDPGQLLVQVDQQLVLLICAGGQYFAMDDVCTHDGGPLSEGALDESAVACPRHGAKFDFRTGSALTMPATQATKVHETKVEDQQVWVRLAE